MNSICSDTLLYVYEYVVCVPLNIMYIRQNNQLIHVATLNISILLQGLTANKQEARNITYILDLSDTHVAFCLCELWLSVPLSLTFIHETSGVN